RGRARRAPGRLTQTSARLISQAQRARRRAAIGVTDLVTGFSGRRAWRWENSFCFGRNRSATVVGRRRRRSFQEKTSKLQTLRPEEPVSNAAQARGRALPQVARGGVRVICTSPFQVDRGDR